MEFLHTIGQKRIKGLISKSYEAFKFLILSVLLTKGVVVAFFALDCAFHLLLDEIPASREKSLQHPDLHCVYPVTTSANVKISQHVAII